MAKSTSGEWAGDVVVNFTTDHEGRPALVIRDMDVLFAVLAEGDEGERDRSRILHSIAGVIGDRLTQACRESDADRATGPCKEGE